jgi:hypothetical protein
VVDKHVGGSEQGAGPPAGTTDKTPVIRVPNLLSVAKTLLKLLLVTFKRLELATVQPFVRSEKAH